MAAQPIRVFISYTHDSEGHRQRVLELSDRLRVDGIDCEIDRYVHQSPPEGWPKWMMRQVAAARYVIVVCTERYCRRVTTDDDPGVGLGGKWEGALITQELYESGGANTKFIPVVFDRADLEYRPPFLRSATFYDLSEHHDYDRLYRHLTDQPSVVKPAIGSVRRMDAAPATTALPPTSIASPDPQHDPKRLASLVLLFPLDANVKALTFEAARIEVAERVTVEVLAEDAVTTALFARLAHHTSLKMGLSFRNSPLLVRLESAKQVVENGDERWVLVFVPSRDHLQPGIVGEMSFSTYSADDIAAMRARRILLGEGQAAATDHGTLSPISGDMLEVLIRGLNTLVEARQTPFPWLYRAIGADPAYFVAVAKLFAQALLYLSATVDRIDRLELELKEDDQLAVRFEGQRPRRFGNVEPPMIKVVGSCDLRQATEPDA